MVRIGINGFGRIGRMVLKSCMIKGMEKLCVTPAAQVVAVNDPYLSVEQMAYLFKHDSTQGRYKGEVSTMGSSIIVDGKIIECYQQADPKNIDWGKTCTDYVIEATGKFTTCAKASKHLDAGPKRVIISSPSDAPTFVVGVNHHTFDQDMVVVGLASCTTHCVAPLVKVLNDNFEVENGLMSFVHPVTSSNTVVDGFAGKRWRMGRSALQNIIPKSTNASKGLGKVLPEMKGKFQAISYRVPVANVSALDLTIKFKHEAPYDLIKCRVKEAADGYMNGILGYTIDNVVSSDFVGDTRSCIFDASAGIPLNNYFVKLVAWYDNEYSTATRLVDMVNYMSSLESDLE